MLVQLFGYNDDCTGGGGVIGDDVGTYAECASCAIGAGAGAGAASDASACACAVMLCFFTNGDTASGRVLLALQVQLGSAGNLLVLELHVSAQMHISFGV